MNPYSFISTTLLWENKFKWTQDNPLDASNTDQFQVEVGYYKSLNKTLFTVNYVNYIGDN